jgi:hypothetical protein
MYVNKYKFYDVIEAKKTSRDFCQNIIEQIANVVNLKECSITGRYEKFNGRESGKYRFVGRYVVIWRSLLKF